MANKRQRKIVERNNNLLRLWDTGSYTIKALANMFKMGESAVGMVIHREYNGWKERREADKPGAIERGGKGRKDV